MSHVQCTKILKRGESLIKFGMWKYFNLISDLNKKMFSITQNFNVVVIRGKTRIVILSKSALKVLMKFVLSVASRVTNKTY